MHRPTLSTAFVLAAALAAGCSSTAPRSGEDEKAYYYSHRSAPAPASAVVRRAPPAPALAPAVAEPSQRIVYFDFDQYDVKTEYRDVVRTHAEYLRARTDRSLVLQGHADERGGTAYNLALGQRRADAVRRALVLQGVPDARIEAISYGNEKPASAERSERGYQLNRRVEFDYR